MVADGEGETRLSHVFGFCNHSGIKWPRLQDTAQDCDSFQLVSYE